MLFKIKTNINQEKWILLLANMWIFQLKALDFISMVMEK